LARFFLLFSILFCLSIEVRARADSIYIDSIVILGNKITKDFIIHRELEFSVGDSVEAMGLDGSITRSRNNIFNTALFNEVDVYQELQGNRTVVTIHLEERWYIWPYPILENADRNFNTWWRTKDFNRLSYGVYLNWFNFRGRAETFQILAKIGYEQQFAIGYNFPNLNKARTLGLHVAAGHTRIKDVNYNSLDNERLFFNDETGALLNTSYAKATMQVRKGLYLRHFITMQYQNVNIDSSIAALNENYLRNETTHSQFFSLIYEAKYDRRDYIEYPLTGYKLEGRVALHGMGILDNQNLNLLMIRAAANFHKPIIGRWYSAAAIIGKTYEIQDPTYYLQEGLGYKDFVRGYEYYVMDAQRYAMIKTNLKYQLIKKKTIPLQWLPWEQFNKPYFSAFLNAFVDVGYAEDRLNAELNGLSNKWLAGYGVGLDISAYYDIVFRIEYSFNIEQEAGLFLHFNKSI
jgi:outer membrane protein assembly factor BamA